MIVAVEKGILGERAPSSVRGRDVLLQQGMSVEEQAGADKAERKVKQSVDVDG